MIRVIEGDLLNAVEDIIGHQVNCKAVMGSGVAKQIKEQFPMAYEDYMHVFLYNNPKYLLGNCYISYTDKYIANLFGQFDYGYGQRHTDYEALENALKQLKHFAAKNGFSVALPYKIGCDRGGGNWDIVYRIIDNVFKNYEVTLYKL